jgi:hypothetical protein
VSAFLTGFYGVKERGAKRALKSQTLLLSLSAAATGGVFNNATIRVAGWSLGGLFLVPPGQQFLNQFAKLAVALSYQIDLSFVVKGRRDIGGHLGVNRSGIPTTFARSAQA